MVASDEINQLKSVYLSLIWVQTVFRGYLQSRERAECGIPSKIKKSLNGIIVTTALQIVGRTCN